MAKLYVKSPSGASAFNTLILNDYYYQAYEPRGSGDWPYLGFAQLPGGLIIFSGHVMKCIDDTQYPFPYLFYAKGGVASQSDPANPTTILPARMQVGWDKNTGYNNWVRIKMTGTTFTSNDENCDFIVIGHKYK